MPPVERAAASSHGSPTTDRPGVNFVPRTQSYHTNSHLSDLQDLQSKSGYALALLHSGLLLPAAATASAGRRRSAKIVIDWVAQIPANQTSIQNVFVNRLLDIATTNAVPKYKISRALVGSSSSTRRIVHARASCSEIARGAATVYKRDLRASSPIGSRVFNHCTDLSVRHTHTSIEL